MNIAGLDVLNLGAGGIVSIGVLAVLRGWLVPRRVLNDLRAATDARVADKELEIARTREGASEWRSTATTKDQTIAAQAKQIDELMDAVRLSQDLLRALPQPRGRGDA